MREFPLDRRGFLKVSAAAAGALSAGSALLMSGCDSHDEALIPRGARPTVLTLREFAVLGAFVDRIVSPEPGWPTAEDTQLAQRIDRELKFHQAKMIEDTRQALLLIEFGGVLHLEFTRFTRMDAAGRDARLADMSTGNGLEKQAFISLRLIAVFFHYTDERTWPHIGYAGPPVLAAKPPPADNRRAP
jgi:hypothetical protein